MLHSRESKRENKRNTQFAAYESKIKRENVGVEDERVYVRETKRKGKSQIERERERERERGWGGGERNKSHLPHLLKKKYP